MICHACLKSFSYFSLPVIKGNETQFLDSCLIGDWFLHHPISPLISSLLQHKAWELFPVPECTLYQSPLQWLHMLPFPTWMTSIYPPELNHHLLQEASSKVVLPLGFSFGELFICSNIICCSSTIEIITLYCIVSVFT